MGAGKGEAGRGGQGRGGAAGRAQRAGHRGQGQQRAGRSAPAATKLVLVLGLSSTLSTLSILSTLSTLSSGLESSGTTSSCGSPTPGLEERSRVSLDSSEVAEVYDEAMEVSACDGRALPAHVGSVPSPIDEVTRCRSERSSSPVESEAVGCAVAAGVAASCEEPTALEPEVAPGVAPRAAGLPLSALAPWPRLRFRLRTSGVLTSEPVLV